MFVEAAGGVLVCGGLACAGSAVTKRARRGSSALLALALGCAAADAFGAPGALHSIACGLAGLAVFVMVLARFGRPLALTWLDFVMGACAVASLSVTTGAELPANLAATGVAAALGLARWRLSLAFAFALAGVAALGELPVLAIVPFVAAAWLREPPAPPAQEFSPIVLAALLAYASTALTLLVVGQFVSLPPVAATLATVTVLTGMARAGLTVVDRLRASHRQAVTDDLTGLGNRRHLLGRLEQAIRDSEGDIALLLIDLDGFKELNDTLGHHAGDQVLRQIGPRLAGAVREHDTMARLGGDEFALVLAPGDEAAASTAGLRIRAALERSFEVAGIAVHIDASVGIALFPEHARDGIGLLQRADVAMYEAKRARTGHEVYLPERDRHSRERLALIGQLHAAIESGELLLHYQPKARVPSGDVHGVEALVRWEHPERGLLGPVEFLPLVEQTGLTRALTAFVLDRALSEMAEMRREGVELEVAVNLGPADLLDLGLPTEVARVIERHASPPHALKLEVSEDIVMADPDRTVDVLDRLRDLGVGVALDDFGAGQSSLGHLRQLQLDELKIDRSFLLRGTDTVEEAAIVRSTVELGHRLGLRVVAEGVATREAWELLMSCQCDEAQGYFISRAMPLGDLRGWLAARMAPQRRA